MTESPLSPESLTADDLASVGFTDVPRALKIITELPGQGVTDEIVGQLLPSLLVALNRSPDPDRALNNFDRWTKSVTSRYTHFQYLIRHPAALEIFVTVCGTSQLFSDILIRNPEYFEILANPGVRGGVKSGGAMYRELSSFVDSVVRLELKLETMRRFKQREILRIGTRDILGLTDMPSTAREFSNLADSCVQKCVEMGLKEIAPAADSHPAFAVIAMGKLGGRELNYSSDIDLIFVMGDEESDSAFAHKLSEFVVNALSRNLANGHLFRVDMRLRPEGRFGALVRSLNSYRAYYESWAEPWELQSLIKARCVAGDPRLGQAFLAMASTFVYRRVVAEKVLESIRSNKRAIERKAEIQGQSYTNVKMGIGGIRDVEFLVQALQLQLGGRNPLLRTPNTLEALSLLRQAGSLSAREAAELADDYQFLRTIEHRLQILYELQTQTMPTDPAERRLLARRMGFADTESFNAEYATRTARVRGHLEHIFYQGRVETEFAGDDGWRALLESVETPQAAGAIEGRLEEIGFREPDRVRRLIAAAVSGTQYGRIRPEARALFLELAPTLIAVCARTGDPDRAFDSIDALAGAVPNRAELFRSLLEGRELLDRICRLGAASPPLAQLLARHLEWLDLLVSDEITDPQPKLKDQVLADLGPRLPRRLGSQGDSVLNPRFWDALALFLQRERLRIAARDVWGEIAGQSVGEELSAVAAAALEGILAEGARRAERQFPTAVSILESAAVIGLGRLGGDELGYGSDWDILLVYDDSRAADDRAYQALNILAEALLTANQELQTRGAQVEIDARLRAEGRFGTLVRSLSEYAEYYSTQALTWERQVLTKARPLAGSPETGRRYLEIVHRILYSNPVTAEQQNEIVEMKRRIEKERLKVEAQETDLKLGHGGLSDIEFTAQLWQLREGTRNPKVRCSNTCEALLALGASGALRAPEAARLSDAHVFISSVRNRLSLLSGHLTDALPQDTTRLRPVAVGLGFTDTGTVRAEDRLTLEVRQRMTDVRQLTERLFYGAPSPKVSN